MTIDDKNDEGIVASIGGTLVFLGWVTMLVIGLALPFGVLYGLVRFVKWAWAD